MLSTGGDCPPTNLQGSYQIDWDCESSWAQIGHSGNARKVHHLEHFGPYCAVLSAAPRRRTRTRVRGAAPPLRAVRVLRRLAPRGRRRGRVRATVAPWAAADGARPAGGRGRGRSAMGNLFGRKKQSRVTEQDRAILVRGRRARARVGRDASLLGAGPGRGDTSVCGPARGSGRFILGVKEDTDPRFGGAWAAPRGRVVTLCPSTRTRLRDTFLNSDPTGTSWARAALRPFASPAL